MVRTFFPASCILKGRVFRIMSKAAFMSADVTAFVLLTLFNADIIDCLKYELGCSHITQESSRTTK